MANFCKQCAEEHLGPGYDDFKDICEPGDLVVVVCEGCEHEPYCIVDHTGRCLRRAEREGERPLRYEPFLVSDDEKERTPISLKGIVIETFDQAKAWIHGTPQTGMRPGYLMSHPELDGKKVTMDIILKQGREGA